MALRLMSLTKSLHFFNSQIKNTAVQSLVELVEKTPINHDSYRLRFKFLDHKIGVGIGHHIRITEVLKTYQISEGEEVLRRYTPISPCGQQDFIDLLVKIYRPNANLSFPSGGKLTPHLQKLKIGDKIHVEGPFGRFQYFQNGKVRTDEQTKQFDHIFLIAGGTGITPCYQIINEIAKKNSDKTKLSLLFANKTQGDILLRKELDALSHRVKLTYLLDHAPSNWSGLKGHVNEEILKSVSPLDDPNTLYVFCGPSAMGKIVEDIFQNKYSASKLFKF